MLALNFEIDACLALVIWCSIVVCLLLIMCLVSVFGLNALICLLLFVALILCLVSMGVSLCFECVLMATRDACNWFWFRLSGNGFQAFKNDKTWFSYSGTRFPKWRNRFPLNLKRVRTGQSALEPGSQFGGTGSCYALLVLNLGRMPWNPVPSLGEPVPAACVVALTWAECPGTRFPVWGNRF